MLAIHHAIHDGWSISAARSRSTGILREVRDYKLRRSSHSSDASSDRVDTPKSWSAELASFNTETFPSLPPTPVYGVTQNTVMPQRLELFPSNRGQIHVVYEGTPSMGSQHIAVHQYSGCYVRYPNSGPIGSRRRDWVHDRSNDRHYSRARPSRLGRRRHGRTRRRRGQSRPLHGGMTTLDSKTLRA